MIADGLAACTLAALLAQVGQTAQPAGPDGTAAGRPATVAATWAGSIPAEDTFSVGVTDPDWWVIDVCRGATVALDLFEVSGGIVEAVMADSGLSELARARASGGGSRLHWIATYDGRVFVRVGVASESGTPVVEYRMRAWWVDALTCPGRADAAAPSASTAPPPPPPLPDATAAGSPSALPLQFVSVTREQPSPSAGSTAPAGRRTTPSGWGDAGVPSEVPTPALPAGVQEHDGFLWRLALGLGYTGWYDHDYWGYYESHAAWEDIVGGGLNMAIGGSLSERLYLFFDFNLDFPQVFAIGAGFGAYLDDNWFVDGTIGYQIATDGYVALTAGKEWWVGEQWLTGLSIRWMGATGWLAVPGEWTTAVTLNWSLTYN